jgi:hypothetical protein
MRQPFISTITVMQKPGIAPGFRIFAATISVVWLSSQGPGMFS